MELIKRKKNSFKREKNILDKRSGGEKVLFTIAAIVLWFHTLTLILPIVFMLMTSLKSSGEYYATKLYDMPTQWLFENFKLAFTSLNYRNITFFDMIYNSVWFTLEKSLINELAPLMVGYVLARYKFPGKKIFTTFILVRTVLPLFTGGGAYMKLMHDLNLYDNRMLLWATSWDGLGLMALLYSAAYAGLSNAYKEAAEIDGASRLQIFVRIETPMIGSFVLVRFVLALMGNWPQYEPFLLYLPSYANLAMGLYKLQTQFSGGGENIPIYFCGLLISAIPTTILFATVSKKMFTSLAIGGLKG